MINFLDNFFLKRRFRHSALIAGGVLCWPSSAGQLPPGPQHAGGGIALDGRASARPTCSC
jgi:hypothetical protein